MNDSDRMTEKPLNSKWFYDNIYIENLENGLGDKQSNILAM